MDEKSSWMRGVNYNRRGPPACDGTCNLGASATDKVAKSSVRVATSRKQSRSTKIGKAP
jgi:hypothetical protein